MRYLSFTDRRRGVLAAGLVGATLAAAGRAGAVPSTGEAKGPHAIVIGVGRERESLGPISGHGNDGELFDNRLAHAAGLRGPRTGCLDPRTRGARCCRSITTRPGRRGSRIGRR
ncbi:hypothetical protein ACIBSV_41955 [Embleya sp. NPDC050154]|uniref:hypothetical protein n=1 Tax=Embleya sp. NPDC050154 TaxID=3363988 RepID=UPI0037A55A88